MSLPAHRVRSSAAHCMRSLLNQSAYGCTFAVLRDRSIRRCYHRRGRSQRRRTARVSGGETYVDAILARYGRPSLPCPRRSRERYFRGGSFCSWLGCRIAACQLYPRVSNGIRPLSLGTPRASHGRGRLLVAPRHYPPPRPPLVSAALAR